jgi:hypothetical protein
LFTISLLCEFLFHCYFEYYGICLETLAGGRDLYNNKYTI